jgi:general secretion pathway protein K
LVRPSRQETGAALLAVLLLVAITGAIAAAAMEKLRLSRALAANVVALDQARAYASGVEQLGLLTIDDLLARGGDKTTLAGNWNGSVRRIPFPDGSVAAVEVRDGGNCFNLNSVVEGDPRTSLARRETGVMQFTGLMMALQVPQGEAQRIADAAADRADSNSEAVRGGAEDGAYGSGDAPYRAANTLFADVGEAQALPGMTAEIFARLRPWLCALPAAELSPINPNTLLPRQAPLLAMLAPGQLTLDRARRVIAARPAAGWDNAVDFWRTEALSELNVPVDAQAQVKMKTSWFALDVRVGVLDSEFREEALVDARLPPSRLAARVWRN